MRSDDFEWDDDKAHTNLGKHKVSFVVASKLFESADLFEDVKEVDEDGEDRWVAVGRLGQRVLYCVFVWRGIRRRIISLRRATRREIEEFERRVEESRRGF